jgi:hypothetical protein
MAGTVRSFRCPVKDGGCGRDHEWRLAVNEEPVTSEMGPMYQLVCVCKCGYRMHFLLAENYEMPSGTIDLSGAPIKME